MQKLKRPICTLLSALWLAGCGGIDPHGSPDGTESEELMRRPPIGVGPIPTVYIPPDPPDPPPPTLETIVSGYQNYDINGDGIVEIESLKFLAGDANNASSPKGLAIVLYDPRLFSDDPTNGISGLQMRLQLALLRTDMWNEGYNPRFLEAKVYRGVEHQDGRTLLALRRFLKTVYASHPLKTVTLVGDFPESSIVRSTLVRSHQGDPRNFGGMMVSNVDYVHSGSELIAPRSDLVLSDLDGNWENLYRKDLATFRDVELVPVLPAGTDFPAVGQVLSGPRYNPVVQTFRDYFIVQDRNTSWTESGGQAYLTIHSISEPGYELSDADRLQPNPIARPEIAVSRINPRHVALEPHLVGTSTDGQGLFGSDGKPRRVYMSGYGSVDWREDPTLEREILGDYLMRNHAFRLGGDGNKPYRTSAVRAIESGLYAPDAFNALLRKADTSFTTSLSVDDADLAGYINWLKEPAILRGIAAHSDQVSSGYKASNAWLVNAMVGGKPWFWRPITDANGTRYLEPTIGERGVADFHLYRTLWENRIFESMSTGQAFYIHDGCSVNLTPESMAYNTPNYAAKQHAESMLFYANGLGMLARAKVFNDTPKNFTETVAIDKRFSAGLRGYFQADAADPNLNPHTATTWPNRRTRTLQRKRTYFWGLLGDPTLRIKYH